MYLKSLSKNLGKVQISLAPLNDGWTSKFEVPKSVNIEQVNISFLKASTYTIFPEWSPILVSKDSTVFARSVTKPGPHL